MADVFGFQQGQQTVDFSVLVKKSAEASFSAFKDLCAVGPELSDTERKIGLLKFINKTRQRLLRLLVLARWCGQMPLVECCQQLVGTLSNHDTSFIQAADSLFFLHEGLQQARAPMYDIPSAVEVLLTGSYRRLPKCIEDLGMQPMLVGDEKESTLQKLDTLLRSRLLDIPLPREMSAVHIANGRVTLRVNEEFEAHLTLGYRGNPSLWRVLHLEILVGEGSGRLKLTGSQELALRDDLERRMAALEDPFQILFSVLHEFCTAWVMDMIIRQVRSLRQGRWRDAIRFEIIQEGSSSSLGQSTGQVQGIALDGETDIGSGKPSSSPALKITYWLDLCKGNDLASLPALRIEQGADHNVACSHVPSVIDPVSNLDAQFQIHLDSVDVERLLLSAIQCNIHTRLREVERCLKSNSQLYRVDTDVVLRTVKSEGNKSEKTLIEESGMVDSGEVGEEVLCVRAYGKSYLALGMNIRTGRFLLRTINMLIASATLKEIEDDLNAGLKNPVDAFITLRNKSLLHLYASIGASIKLKPFEKGALVFKVPADSLKLGPDALIMGFPNCGERFFLALQLDSSFMPVLTLLEAQLQSSNGQNSVLGGLVKVVATLDIPYHSLAATEDEVNFSLFDGSRVNLHHKDAVSNVSLHGIETDSAPNALVGCKRYETLSGSSADGCKSSPAALENWPNPDADKPFSGKISFPSVQMFNQSVESGQHGNLGFSNQTSTNKALPQNSLAGKSFSGIPGTISSGWSAGVRQPNLMPAVGSPGATGSPSRNTSGAVGSPSRNPSTVLTSPSRGSSFQRGTLGSRQGTDTETLLSKSPLNPGDSASSPINLDDDDLSKLIDTIASKSTVGTTSGSNNFEDGVLLTSPSRQARMATPVRGSPLYRSSVPSSKPSAAKGSVPPGSLSRNPVLSPGGSAHTPSPARRSPVPDSLVSRTENANNVLESSEMTEHTHPSLGLSSPTKPVPSPMSVHLQQIISVQAASSMDKSSERKRKGSDIIFTLPVLQGHPSIQTFKKRKLECEAEMQAVDSLAITTSGSGGLSSAIQQTVGQTYPSLLSAANQGEASMYTYTAFLLQASRRCSLCIKYSRLLSQMFSCGISSSEEIGYRRPSSNMWFRLPKIRRDCRSSNHGGWELFRLCLGKPGSTAWEVRVNDDYFKELYELQHQKGLSHGVQVIASEADSHIQCTPYGLILMYELVEDNSIQNMLADLERLWNARVFALGIKQVLEVKGDEKGELTKLQNKGYTNGIEGEKITEVMRKASRIEAVGITSVWFSYTISVGSVNARFVVEWERGKKGCTVHVSPDQLWPHTKHLEDFINAGEIELLLSCIRVTAGPLHSLASAVRPARMPVSTTPIGPAANTGTTGLTKAVGQVLSPSNPSVTSPSNPGRVLTGGLSGSGNAMAIGSSMQAAQTGAIVSGPGRGTGLVPSSLLPTDVSVVLRSPYWIRIFYRRQFAVDMRCFSGDHVWLQPAPPPQGSGPGAKGSLPCPQFRPFVVEQITACYNSLDSAPAPSVVALVGQPAQAGGVTGSATNLGQVSAGTSSRVSVGPAGVARPSFGSGNPQAGSLLRVANTGNVVSQQSLGPLNNMTAGRSMVPGISMSFHPSHRELNAAGYGFSDDGGYGGVWVPLAFLKKVLRGTLRYLGVVWLFAQFPGIIKEVLASHLKETEGTLLNHDPETPALRFFIRNCVFAVSVHRQQLVLQAINVKRYQNQPQQQPQQQQQQQQQSQQTHQPQVQQIQQSQSQQSQPLQQPGIAGSDNDLSLAEMQEIGDFFARRAAFEPYDASRLASFVTMLTLPVPVLREFIVLIAWKKDSAKTGQHVQVSDPSQPPRPKLELCLENRSVGVGQDACAQEDTISQGGGSSSPKSSVHYDRSRSLVEFTLTVIFDPSHVPHINVAGGAGWLPQCVAVRLRYMFGEGNSISLIGMEGSHGGRACWSRIEDWERCKEKVARAVEVSGGGNVTDQGQGRLQAVAETIQTALQSALQQLRRGTVNTPPMAGAT